MKYIYYLLLLIPFSACAQHNAGIKRINIRDEIAGLKNFSDEPIYQLRVKTAYSFTILINGIPIANKYVPYWSSNYFTEINSCIPEKGEQQIEIRVYPASADENTQKDALEKGVDFELAIEKTAWKNGSLEEPEIVYHYRLPDEDYSGRKSFIHSDVFTANTPYQLIDWRKGKTFHPQDSARLKDRALQVYEKLISYYENQEGEKYVNAIGRGLFNLCQSSYFNEEEALDHLNHRVNFINKKKRDLAAIANYKLEILAKGKLLSLQRTDGYNRGEGVIRRYYMKGPKEMVHIDQVLLYAPANSKDDELEVIWHRNLVKGAQP